MRAGGNWGPLSVLMQQTRAMVRNLGGGGVGASRRPSTLLLYLSVDEEWERLKALQQVQRRPSLGMQYLMAALHREGYPFAYRDQVVEDFTLEDAYCAGRIAELLDGERTVGQVAVALRDDVDGGPDDLTGEVIAFLDSLRARDLVQ